MNLKDYISLPFALFTNAYIAQGWHLRSDIYETLKSNSKQVKRKSGTALRRDYKRFKNNESSSKIQVKSLDTLDDITVEIEN